MDGEPSSLADEAPLARAARLAHAGDLAAALELREVLALRPGHAEAHGRLGLVLYQQGFEAEAIWHLKSAVRRSGQSRRWERALKEVVDSGLDRAERKRLEDAFNALAQGRAAEALAEFQDLSARRPRAAAAWVGLRSALHALGRFEEAAEAADRWRGVSPSHRAGVEAALARPLSRRGLVFDPREPLPVRPMAEVLTRVGSPEELARTPNAYLQIDAEPLPIHCTPVISLEPDGSDAMDIHAWTTPRVMARIDDALLAGRGLVVTRSGEVISELLSHRSWGAQLRDGMLHFPAGAHGDGAGRVQVFDSPALVMAGPTDRVYGDWINQYPTRLSIAEAAGVDSPPVIRWDLPERYVQMLEEVGVDADRLMRHNQFASIFPQLYVTSWPLETRHQPMQAWFDVYRRAWRPPPAERRRIYLTRRRIDHRSLVNEPEIAEIFARRGFEIVAPETLELSQMIELFAGPSIVAGPYGSAVRSMVFCRQKPAVFTIMPPYPRHFVEGSGLFFHQLGVRFAWVQGQAAPGGDPSEPNESAWTIDPALVERRLDALLDYLSHNAETAAEPA